ncbi:zinc-binding dehydrogenase [Arthrobacter sp. H20]|uniref:zinc-binding dehydrogenase n=1 Tax=Arthrobacter sp. H20 TaxID=1267981 RepID=UPI001C1DE5E8|nr:zinc-binding dehydrogenase [Arthrobacter sp. H20]
MPRPRSQEVLVRVSAAGCNNTDIWTREGSYGLGSESNEKGGWLGPLAFPRIQGGDVAGVVVADGDGNTSDLLQTRVLVDPAIYSDSGQDARPVDVLPRERDGGFAEYVVVPAARVHPVDDSPLTDIELAALPISYGTALAMLERGAVDIGHTVLVTGASGGVGLAVVQLAKARGARVVAVCSGGKADEVLRAGADVTIDRQRGEVLKDVREAAPHGYHAAIDVVAGPLIGPGLELLRPGGCWVVAGSLDGWSVKLDVRKLYLSDLSLLGSTMHTPRIFELLVGLARRGEVRPVIAATFGLDETRKAHQELSRRHHVGKLVIVP